MAQREVTRITVGAIRQIIKEEILRESLNDLSMELTRAGLSEDEIPLVHQWLDRQIGDDTFGPVFDKLFEYYMNSGDMPYGTMKARDGDPYLWIYDTLTDLRELKDYRSTRSTTTEDEDDNVLHDVLNAGSRK